MRRTFAVIVLALLVIAVPFYMTAQTSGGGEVNHPNSPGYQTDDARGGFDFGWLGLLGLAGLLGLRHTNRNAVVTR